MVDFKKIPFVEAKYFEKKDKVDRKPAAIVIHTMEASEAGNTAENVANYFKNMPDGREASAHYCVDSNSIVQCVQCRDIAWGAGGFNERAIHIELAGYSSQTTGQWNDTYSASMIDLAAQLCAKVLIPKYGINPHWVSDNELKQIAAGNDLTGFTYHAQITKVFKKSTHEDPGPGFPFNRFMDLVKHYMTVK